MLFICNLMVCIADFIGIMSKRLFQNYNFIINTTKLYMKKRKKKK
jgi:hypothetical protein